MEVEFVDLSVYRIYAWYSKERGYRLATNVNPRSNRDPKSAFYIELGIDKKTGEVTVLKQINAKKV